jgi:hypothetical protein
VITRYVYDGDDLLMEADGAENVQAQYTYYPGTDDAHGVRLEKMGRRGVRELWRRSHIRVHAAEGELLRIWIMMKKRLGTRFGGWWRAAALQVRLLLAGFAVFALGSAVLIVGLSLSWLWLGYSGFAILVLGMGLLVLAVFLELIDFVRLLSNRNR